MPPVIAFVVMTFSGVVQGRYRRTVEALYWGRWEETLRRAERLGGIASPHEIALRKAQALAGLDRLDEGLRLVEPFGDGVAVPDWYFQSMLAQVYEFAARRDDAIARMEEAVELAPDNATMVIGLARLVVLYKRDARRSRDLLSLARAHALSDMTAPYADQLEGFVLLEEGRPRDAVAVLEATSRVFQARRHFPLGRLPVEAAMLGRALAHAALGESEAALNLYRKVRPRLVALRSEWIDRCDRTIGLPDISI